jgi:hypothetical protein
MKWFFVKTKRTYLTHHHLELKSPQHPSTHTWPVSPKFQPHLRQWCHGQPWGPRLRWDLTSPRWECSCQPRPHRIHVLMITKATSVEGKVHPFFLTGSSHQGAQYRIPPWGPPELLVVHRAFFLSPPVLATVRGEPYLTLHANVTTRRVPSLARKFLSGPAQ